MKRFAAIGLMTTALLLSGCASGPSAELEKGWKLMLAQDYAAARDHYESMLVDYPTNPYAHLNLGVAYQQLGETELARQQYEAAIEHGGSAEVTRVAEREDIESRTSTVADLARQNLAGLSN